MATGKLASLLIKIAANGAEAEKEIRKLERKVNEFGKNMKEVGAKMSTYLTAPLVAAGAVAVRSANRQLQAEQRLLTALNGRKDVQERLMQQAAELQSRSIYGDEAIIEQQAFLAALGLTETQINATINAAAQLSAALDMEFSSAVRNLSKTYSGLAGELGESIPALRNLTAEEMAAGAAIAYVNDNYKGFAETAAQAGAGPLPQLKNTLGDIAEQFGTVLVPVIQKLATKIKEIAEKFQKLSPETRELIVSVAAFVAAVGPLLTIGGKLIMGLRTVIAILPTLGTALATLTANPVAAAITAVGLLAAGWLRARDNMREYEQEAMRKAREQGKVDGEKEVADEIAAAKSVYDRFDTETLERKRAMLVAAIGQKKGRGESTYKESIEFSAIVDLLKQRKAAQDAVNQSTEQGIQLAKKEVKVLSEGITLSGSKAALTSMSKVDMSASPLEMMLNNFTIDQWREQMMAEAQKIAEINNEVAAIIQGSFADAATALGEGIGNLISGEAFNPLQDFLKILGNTLQQLGAALISYAATMEAVKKALATAFATPWVALAAGIAATAAGVALVNLAKKPVKLATGGLAYGPTLAVVGDNPGASSDPEVVAPLSKLSKYLGGQKMELVGSIDWVLEGDSLRAVLNRENIRLSTLR